MKFSVPTSRLLRLSIFVLTLTTCYRTGTASPILDIPQTTPHTHLQEYCLNNAAHSVIGLKPYVTDSEDKIDDCRHFWECHVSDPVLTRNKTIFEPQIQALKFSCATADISKPFYDASKCECVSESNHCKDNVNFQYTCTREASREVVEPLESCRVFGKEEKYYKENFPHFDDPHKFWKCGPSDNIRTQAYIHPCNPASLVWDSRTCQCDYDSPGIHEINKHPMNRFRCAFEYPEVSSTTVAS